MHSQSFLLQVEGIREMLDVYRQSVLNHAFFGQLFPQDPADESASVLMELIKTEKAARSKNSTRTKRKREKVKA